MIIVHSLRYGTLCIVHSLQRHSTLVPVSHVRRQGSKPSQLQHHSKVKPAQLRMSREGWTWPGSRVKAFRSVYCHPDLWIVILVSLAFQDLNIPSSHLLITSSQNYPVKLGLKSSLFTLNPTKIQDLLSSLAMNKTLQRLNRSSHSQFQYPMFDCGVTGPSGKFFRTMMVLTSHEDSLGWSEVWNCSDTLNLRSEGGDSWQGKGENLTRRFSGVVILPEISVQCTSSSNQITKP